MDTELVTKRLHVSGLTSSITSTELSRRLSTFGTIKDIDGFGKFDALGQPRKFAYVTLEGTKAQLAKCVNVLSGSTWKGAKLRIGDAKPDYRERMEKEIIADIDPKKKRKRVVNIHAPDMTLVTPSNISERKGWKVTAMGRIVRPVKMRPDRPLPPQTSSTLRQDGKGKDGKGKKKRIKAPDVRARRRTIDPTKWDSVLLKGMFLDVVSADAERQDRRQMDIDDSDKSGSESESDESSDESGESSNEKTTDSDVHEQVSQSAKSSSPLALAQPSLSVQAAVSPSPPHVGNINLAHEKAASLSLLHSLFSHDDNWGGRESVGSDIDEEEVERLKREGRTSGGVDTGGGDEVEEVPMVVDAGGDLTNESEEVLHETQEISRSKPVVERLGRPSMQQTKLKDLFAPREEDAGFSLLGHLDLDLELDDDIDILDFNQSLPAPVNESPPSAAAQPPVPLSQTFTYDPSLPLFFPHPSSFSSERPTARHKDLFTVARERGWDPASAGFYRTGTEEEIRKRWEEAKGELTREWKRRFREAGKMRRRRGGGDGD